VALAVLSAPLLAAPAAAQARFTTIYNAVGWFPNGLTLVDGTLYSFPYGKGRAVVNPGKLTLAADGTLYGTAYGSTAYGGDGLAAAFTLTPPASAGGPGPTQSYANFEGPSPTRRWSSATATYTAPPRRRTVAPSLSCNRHRSQAATGLRPISTSSPTAKCRSAN
jgi:hypothetical protein